MEFLQIHKVYSFLGRYYRNLVPQIKTYHYGFWSSKSRKRNICSQCSHRRFRWNRWEDCLTPSWYCSSMKKGALGSPKYTRRSWLVRRSDLMIMPLLLEVYLMQFIGKTLSKFKIFPWEDALNFSQLWLYNTVNFGFKSIVCGYSMLEGSIKIKITHFNIEVLTLFLS